MFFGKAVVNWVVDEREGRELERERERENVLLLLGGCLFVLVFGCM